MAQAAPETRIDRLFRERAEARRREAVRLALDALSALERAGVRAVVVGSLARGRFLGHSDVDLFVEGQNGLTPEVVVGLVERAMGDFPFDVIFEDWTPADDLPFILDRTLDAAELKRLCS